MRFNFRATIGFFASLVLSTQALANAAVTSSTSTIQNPKKVESKWGGFANVSRSTSLYDFNDGTRRDGMDYMVRLNYKVNKEFSLRAQGGYSQDLKYPESNDFSDISMSLLRAPVAVGNNFLIGYRAGMGLPASKDSRIRQNLQASASAGVNIMVNPERLISGFEIVGSLGVGRNFHQYDTALDGRVNTQYSATQTLDLSYSFESGVSLSANFMQRNTWSYQNVQRNSFELSQEVSYSLSPQWILAGGHSNSGSTLKPNGTDSNIQVYDDNNSVVYLSTTVVF